ncbi:MAG: tetratricopeptide repeat protein [Planctomycetales bacterium]|nr:tetratricopeptide repeat protein [Planctomycetales bacterium]
MSLQDSDPQTSRTQQSSVASQSTWILVLVLVSIAAAGFLSSASVFDYSKALPTTAFELATTPAANPTNDRPQIPDASVPPLSAWLPEASLETIEECRNVCEHLVRLVPDLLESKEMLARFEFEFGDLQRAASLWNEILEKNPNFVYALRGLGDIATLDGNLPEAIVYFRRALNIDPQSLSWKLTLGSALLQAGQLDEARQVLQDVVNRSPQNDEAHLQLAQVLAQLNEIDASITEFETAIALNPDDRAARIGLISAYGRAGRMDDAKQQRENLNGLQVTVAEQRKTGRQNYDDVTAIRIDIARMYVDVARVHLAVGNAETAKLLLMRAHSMDPHDLDSRQALAYLAVSQGQPHNAIRWLLEIANLDNQTWSTISEIVRLYLELGKINESEETLIEFANNHTDSLQVERELVRFYTQVKPDKALAIDHAAKATRLSNSAEDFGMLASVYENFQEPELAIQALKNAVELEPENNTYRELLDLMFRDGETPPTLQPSSSPSSGQPQLQP